MGQRRHNEEISMGNVFLANNPHDEEEEGKDDLHALPGEFLAHFSFFSHSSSGF